MSITTFTALISTPSTRKVFLVEAEPTRRITAWETYGTVHRYDFGSADVYHEVTEVKHNSATMSLAVVTFTASGVVGMGLGSYYVYGRYLLVRVASGSVYTGTIVAKQKMRWATDPVVLSGTFYEPIVKQAPIVNQMSDEFYYSVSLMNDGEVVLANDKGQLDREFANCAWEGATISVHVGGEDLPRSAYEKMFDGRVDVAQMRSDEVLLGYIDNKDVWQETPVRNRFGVAQFPWLDEDDEGEPIPQVWGTVYKLPVICTTKAKGTATNVHSFKVADTAVNSIGAISQVYVDGVPVTHFSASLAAATFKLSSTVFEPGQKVSVDASGYLSGSVAVTNPVRILKALGVAVGLSDSDWDSTLVDEAIEAANELNCALVIDGGEEAIDLAGKLMASCMGRFFVTNAGLYAVKIWGTLAEPLAVIDEHDVIDGSLEVKRETANIFSRIVVAYAKRIEDEKWNYKTKTSAEVERTYGKVRSKEIETLLSDEAGAEVLADRLLYFYNAAVLLIGFECKLQLSSLYQGSRFTLSWRRRGEDAYVSWLDGETVEIKTIEKDYVESTMRITGYAVGAIGANVGHWTAADPQLPDNVGGGDAAPWDEEWSAMQRSGARQYGYWLDGNGFADADDLNSLNVSRWW